MKKESVPFLDLIHDYTCIWNGYIVLSSIKIDFFFFRTYKYTENNFMCCILLYNIKARGLLNGKIGIHENIIRYIAFRVCFDLWIERNKLFACHKTSSTGWKCRLHSLNTFYNQIVHSNEYDLESCHNILKHFSRKNCRIW